MIEETIILPESEESAVQVTMTLWKSRTGKLFVEESAAKLDGATHSVCQDCGKPSQKFYLRCSSCGKLEDARRYEARPKKEWDGTTPLYSDKYDQYFFSLEEAEELLEEGETLADLWLRICEPVYARSLESDYYESELPEDGECPDWLLDAIESFNKQLEGKEPLSYVPGKFSLKLNEEGK